MKIKMFQKFIILVSMITISACLNAQNNIIDSRISNTNAPQLISKKVFDKRQIETCKKTNLKTTICARIKRTKIKKIIIEKRNNKIIERVTNTRDVA